MRKVVLFDLGNTLVRYYDRAEFAPLLERGIARVAARLRADGRLRVDPDSVRQRTATEDHEAPDHRVRPMEARISRIFEIEEGFAVGLCEELMAPIFEVGRRYPEVLRVLEALRGRGIRTGVVSNSPWGGPADLWRGELRRQGLVAFLEPAVFCRDIGWRKPDRRIIDFALRRADAEPADCLYVGDNPRWDRAGPAGVGMESVLVERGDYVPDGGPSVRDLDGIFRFL